MPAVIYLKREDIVECTGVERLEEIKDLEILFATFDEMASLQHCPNLRRLTLLDNGLRRISNLAPVAMTLQVLCLCDQAISEMDNINLPHLRELFLHRNQIKEISSLAGCPRLKKIWLFQNQLESISGVQALSELEECWLQANAITSLTGFEYNLNLTNLGLAGNLISDLREVKKLRHCTKLKQVTFTDIHFGRCPIVDEDGYKEYLLLQLKQVNILDGVKVTNEKLNQADDAYYRQMSVFQEQLSEIDDDFQKSLRGIELQHQSRESYSQVLEKEMSAALKELQSLVDEGRKIVSKEIEHTEQLLLTNFHSLQNNLLSLEERSRHTLQEQLHLTTEEHQLSMNILHLLEVVEGNHSRITTMLNELATMLNQSKQTVFVFQLIGSNAADFQLFSSIIDTSHRLHASHPGSQQQQQDLTITEASDSAKITPRNKRNAPSSSLNTVTGDLLPSENPLDVRVLELAKLYRLVHSTRRQSNNNSPNSKKNNSSVAPTNGPRVFMVLTLDALRLALLHGWEALQQSSAKASNEGETPMASVVCSEDAELMSYLYEYHPATTTLQPERSMDDKTLEQEAEAQMMRIVSRRVPLPISLSNNGKITTSSGALTSMGKPVVLLSGRLVCSLESLLSTYKATSSSVSLPSLPMQRSMMVNELQCMEKLKIATARNRININIPGGQASKLVTIPVGLCEEILQLEHICLAVMHAPLSDWQAVGHDPAMIATGGSMQSPTKNGQYAMTIVPLLKSLESRLEMLLLPSHHSDIAADTLRRFESDASQVVGRYVDQLLEGVDESEANTLRQTEQEVSKQEVALKTVREEIERERRGQEVQLRELKAQAQVVESSSNMNNNSSATKLNVGNNGRSYSGKR